MRGVNRGHRVWPSLLVACVLALGGLAEAIGPTLIPQVDEFIDAPRALFGRTRAEIERVLGAPPYPGVVIRYSPSSALTSVAITTPTYHLPQGLGVGASRRDVERLLGEPQEMTEGRSRAAGGRHSCAITSSAPNPPTSSRSFASLAATVSGSPTIQMLSRRYSSVTSESGIAGSTLIISSPRIFPKSRKK